MIDKRAVILMKLNTHDRTPRPRNSRLINALFVVCGILIFGIFGSLSFACFYYAQSIVGGILVIFIPILLTAIILVHIKDMKKAGPRPMLHGFIISVLVVIVALLVEIAMGIV